MALHVILTLMRRQSTTQNYLHIFASKNLLRQTSFKTVQHELSYQQSPFFLP